MAITVEARTSIIELVVGMFGAAPGASVLSDLVAAYEAGQTIKQIAANLAKTAEFTNIFPTFLTNAEYATKVVDQLVGTEVVAAEKAAAVTTLTAMLNAGASRSSVFVDAIDAIDAITSSNTAWANAGAALDNKVAAAVYFSVDKQLSGSTLSELQDVVRTVTSVASTLTASKGRSDGDSTEGGSFTLTINQDNLTGTKNDDTFTAGVSTAADGTTLVDTLQSIDQVVGGEGVDTLKATMNKGNATTAPTLTGVENLEVRSTAAGSGLTLTGATGITKITVANSTNTAAVNSVGAVATLAVADQKTNVSFDGQTATTLAVQLSNVGTVSATAPVQVVVDLGAAAASKATTLNITTSTSNVEVNDTTGANVATAATIAATGSNTLKLTDGLALGSLTVTGTGSVNVSSVGLVKVATLTVGDGGVTFSTGDSTATTFTATTGAGADTLTVDGDNVKTISTGAGADKVTTATAALVATASIDLGAGDDTLTLHATPVTGVTLGGGDGVDTLAALTAGYEAITGFAAGNLAKITGFEALSITDVLADTKNLDLSKVTGLVSFQTVGVAAAGNATVSNVGAAATVTIKGDIATNTGGLTVTLKDATGTSDVLNLVVNSNYTENNDATATVQARTATVTAAGVETINVTSSGTGSATFTGAVGNLADGSNNTLALTNTALTTLNVSGAQQLTFNTADTQTKLATINAAANTAGVTISAAATVTSTNAALTITGSATAANTLTGSANADTIVGGSKADVITGGAGNDTLTGGAGNDSYVYANTAHSTLLKLDTITDFVANTYGNGASGAAGTGANATASLRNGDLIRIDVTTINLNTAASLVDGVVASVQSNAADAQTFLQNLGIDATAANDNAVGVALDSSTGRLYIDVDSNGTVDSVIQLTGVTTITAAAFTLV